VAFTSPASPAVSVVLAVHNGERYLREAVESVLAQSLSNFELVAIDDGSTDATGAILADYAANDSRIVVHRQANAGVAEARNRGFTLASAPLVANLDADDVVLPTRLEQQREFMAHHPEVAVVGGAVSFIDAGGREFGEWRYPSTDAAIRSALAHTTPLAHSATTIRKDAFFAVGGYRRLLVPAEDLDLWLRIAEQHELANLAVVMVRYRVHREQATVRTFEVQALGSLGARIAARARAEGRPDPLDAIDRIDRGTLLGIGATEEDVAAAVVHTLTWVARTLGKAGYVPDSERLFLEAKRRAWAEAFPELAVHVHRQHARLHREQGRRVPFALESLRAVRAGRGARAPRGR
jgi:glycosyltransferase involved in cell wall biosynthesis